MKDQKKISYQLLDPLSEDKWMLVIDEEGWKIDGTGDKDSTLRDLLGKIRERGVMTIGVSINSERVEHYGTMVKDPYDKNYANGLMAETFKIGITVRRVDDDQAE